MLDREREFYTAHLNEWAPAHNGQFVAIRDEEVIGFFDGPDEALAAGAARCGLSSFLMRCVGEEERTVTIPALALGVLGAHS